MKRYLLSSTLLVLNILQMLAYDRHGRDYSVKGGGGSSSIMMIIVVVGFIVYCYISARKEDK